MIWEEATLTFTSLARCFADVALEPLRTDHRGQQVGKDESGYHSSQVNHFGTSDFLACNKKSVTEAHDRQAQ